MVGKLMGSKSAYRGGSGGYQKTENVVIVMDKIVTGKGANWETDHFEGRLYYDALGQKAEYSSTGELTTSVKVFQGKPKDGEVDGKRPRPAIYDRKFKTPMVDALEPGAVVLMENCVYDKDKGGFVGGWMKVLSPKALDVATQFVAHGYIMVRPERASRNEGGRPYQTSTMVMGNYSLSFKGRDEFREQAVAMIKQDLAQPSMPGTPGVILRVVDVEAKQAMISEIYAGWDADLGRNRKPEEAVDAFLAAEDAKKNDSDPEIQANSFTAAMDDDYFFEIVPASLISTGSQSLPSVRFEDKVKPGDDGKRKGSPADFDDAVSHFTYGVDDVDNDGKPRTYARTGFMLSHVFAVRKHGSTVKEWDGPVDDSPEAYTRWSRTYTRPTGENRDMRARTEFPSASLPAEVEAVFAKNAKDHGASAIKWRKARREANEPASESSAEQEMASPKGP